MGHFHPDGQELLIDTITRKLGYKFYEAQIDLLTPSMKKVTLSYLIKARAAVAVVDIAVDQFKALLRHILFQNPPLGVTV